MAKLLFLFVLCFSFCANLCYSQDRIKSINIVADDNYPPYIFRDEKGIIQGLIVDEWRLWESKTGIHANIIAMDWGKAYSYMLMGKADVLETVFYNEERARIFDFTKPYAEIEVPVFFNNTLSGIKDLSTIRGFTIGVKSGDACIDIFKQNGIETLKEYSNYESIIKAASNGDIKVFCIDKPPALYYLYKNNLESKFNYSFTLFKGEFHRAVKKGQTELLKTIENGFDRISKNEKEKIENKWLGTILPQPDYIRYVIYSLLTVTLIALILVLFNLFLRKKVREKTHQLKKALEEVIKAKEKAERSDKLKSEFLAQISHEIRSPLNVILSFADLIKTDLKDKIKPEAMDYFKFIASAGRRLIRTVDLVLNASEMQLGTYEPTFSEFDLVEEIISKIRQEYKQVVADKGLEFKFTSNIPDTTILADKYSVYQIFVNLIENAVKYTDQGFISLSLDCSDDTGIIVNIEDTGIGMSKEFLLNLFSPFMQEERGYSRRFEGNGLGLSLVKKYCEMNGASITVESKKGKGSKFTVIFKKTDKGIKKPHV